MSEKPQEHNLALSMQDLMAQVAAMRAELDSLKTRADALPKRTVKPKPEVSTTRRRVLRRLAGGLVAGLAVGGIGVSLPRDAEAKLSSNPTGNGLTGRVGMLVMPPGSTVSGIMGGDSTKVGLLVGGDTVFYANAVAPTVNSAIIAYSSSNGSAISGVSDAGIAVYGQSLANFAVRGASTTSHGVYGTTANTSQIPAAGVLGTATGTINAGVHGANDTGYGVYGDSKVGAGVYGNSESGYGVAGSSSNGYAGSFNGKVRVTGNLEVGGTISKGGGSFKIDHPLDPENKYLYHSFVESPDMMNIYNGIVNLDGRGEATVEMPDWFEALNYDFRYQLTCLGEFAPVFISEEMKERKFKIAGGQPGQKISWMVTGIRQDAFAKAHRSPVEEDKTGDEKGKYLHLEVFGRPEEK